jgi:hypothetical protein
MKRQRIKGTVFLTILGFSFQALDLATLAVAAGF